MFEAQLQALERRQETLQVAAQQQWTVTTAQIGAQWGVHYQQIGARPNGSAGSGAIRQDQYVAMEPLLGEITKQKRLANDKAEKLLLSKLSVVERIQYESGGFLIVKGSSGRVFKVPKCGFIRVYDKRGCPVDQWCVALTGVPIADNLLALKLSLEANDKEVQDRANSQGDERRRLQGRAPAGLFERLVAAGQNLIHS